MTPSWKAFHLYFKYCKEVPSDKIKAKQCALIAVDEILNKLIGDNLVVNYWQEVKQEIEKL